MTPINDQRNRARSLNLLEGPLARTLGRLALPIMGASLIQMAYTLTDMFWVGRLGATAVAAVGTGGNYLWFADSLMQMANVGGRSRCAQLLGGGQTDRARVYARAALQLGFFLGLAYCLLLMAAHKSLIGFFNFHQAETVRMGEIYLLLTAPGLIVSFLGKILVGLFTASGDSKTPFIVTTIGLICNMILDPLFIFPLKLGVAGAAIATSLAQLIVVLLFIKPMRQTLFLSKLPFHKPAPSAVYKQIMRIGLPAGLQNAVYSGVSLVIGRMIAVFGDAAVAAQRIGSQVEGLSWLSAEGISSGINAVIGQNIGAGHRQRARHAYRVALAFTVLIGGISTLLLLLFPGQLIGLFVQDSVTRSVGTHYFIIIAFSQIFMCVELTTVGAFSGYGATGIPALFCTLLTALRIPLALLLSAGSLGLNGIWWAISVSSIAKGCVLFLAFLLSEKRLQARFDDFYQ